MDNLYIDIIKGGHELDKGKLVKRAVQVQGKNGRTFTRMQWVDPTDGQPVFHRQPKVQEHEKTPEERQQERTDRMNGKKKDYGTPENLKPVPAKLGLRHTEHGLPDSEVSKRHGHVGQLDIQKLTEGTPLLDAVQDHIKFSKRLLSQNPYTKDVHDKVEVENHVTNIFKNVTKEGVEHVFSAPDGSYTAHIVGFSVHGNKDKGYIECGFDIDWKDKNGKSMGGTSRSLYRDKNGHLHVYTERTEVNKKYQGKGVGAHDQERTEQFWKYLSDGHPVHLGLEADISVGTYAWATKGYDFEHEEDIHLARTELKDFLESNGMDTKEILNKCGYNSLDDLEHSWQFAYLHTGEFYNITDLMQTDNNFDGDIKKSAVGHLGKAFMLGGKQYWEGEKVLNGGTDHEHISEAHYKIKPPAKTRKKKEV